VAKQNRLFILLLIAVAVTGVGLAVWQHYELNMALKKQKLHVAQAAYRGAYFLHTTRISIDAMNEENNWDDRKTRDSFRIWLSYGEESLVNAKSTLNDFPSLVTFQDRTNMNDISNWYSQWWGEAANILGKPGPLTKEDKARISKLSDIVSKIDDFYIPLKFNDWDGISASFSELHMEWKKAIEEQQSIEQTETIVE
jgi:hypothetical protein